MGGMHLNQMRSCFKSLMDQLTRSQGLLSTSDHMTKCGRPCAWEAEFLGGRGRPWEAVLSDWITKIRSDQRANQGSTASHGLPQPHKLSEFHLKI